MSGARAPQPRVCTQSIYIHCKYEHTAQHEAPVQLDLRGTLLPTADVCFSPIVSTVGYYFPSTLASFLGGFSPQTSSPFASHSIGAFFLHFM